MKKIIFTIALLASVICTTNAQVDGNAIGVRFGYGGEISYQHAMGDANRLEFDLGLNSWNFGLSGIYHWVFDLSSVTDGLNWYLGPGVQLGSTYGTGISNGLLLGIMGQIGAEYNFDFPLQLSLDYRPAIYVVRPSWRNIGNYDGVCLSVRYKF